MAFLYNRFVWSDGSIQEALAQVYMANLPVTSTEITYYQEYSVKFIHTTEVDNEIDTKLPSHLYGKLKILIEHI